jgi:hypothetical protein|tara:strand:+ start:401 stop:598 length:198 start_codon:yes stop_codon:yes gene_type:complete
MNIHDPHNSRALARLMNKVRAGHGDRWLQFMKDAHELPDMEAMRKKWKGDPSRFTDINVGYDDPD